MQAALTSRVCSWRLITGKGGFCVMASRKQLMTTKRRKLNTQQNVLAAGSRPNTTDLATSLKDDTIAEGKAAALYATRQSKLPSSQSVPVPASASAKKKTSELSHVQEAPSGAVLASLKIPAATAERASTGIVRRIDSLVTGRLVKRYKRFLADVQVTSEHTVVHCPNTGPMTGLLDFPMANVWLSTSANAKRKYAHTLEAIQPDPHGPWVGVHSASANGIVHEMLQQQLLADLLPYAGIRQEVKYGEGGKSRVDFVLETPDGGSMYVEVKSGGASEHAPKIALFPDTVSDRAQRHVRDLMGIVAAGGQAVMVFIIQRGDCAYFGPCHAKDPTYGKLVIEAAAMGVRVIALRCGLEGDAANGRGIVRYIGPAQVMLQHGL
ncbi:SfsA-domain-containing protein [Coccomyxa subellipsoidea C-169]|uniref:SfsA-domain-containing protein n=1 Tax=Coccomyxa subellipsoidea (strain C-169) TaxID=574566 RepID=I0YRH2_COCSC|nr:SfsA-domain-containing protein [Coccomyxa subellipsoidea C-169]EIE20991.1 SfsA-domain-containing protein [Coccomyxa subellipsoidea C-169]|eukprot:XP_005645535.1 SfsA-domain-containing protein [Coccomyxa subellipsoidea C-169]